MMTFTGLKPGFSDYLQELISISAKTFKESNLVIRGADTNKYDEYAIGRKGIFRVGEEYTYRGNRIYNSGSARKEGLFNIYIPWKRMTYDVDTCSAGGSGVTDVCALPNRRFIAAFTKPDFDDKWIKAREITKWTPFATEIENVDAINNRSTAVYGYNEELLVAVAYNASQGQVLAEGFEDYCMLQPKNKWMHLVYSPFKKQFSTSNLSGTNHMVYNTSSGSNGLSLERNNTNGTFTAHSGTYALKTSSSFAMLIDTFKPNSNNYYNPMSIAKTEGKLHVLSYWVRPTGTLTAATNTYSGVDATFSNATVRSTRRSNIIEGWQQVEITFEKNSTPAPVTITFPGSKYYDDLRIYPLDANMKSFVYNPVNQKLMATLDENNYATFYEYDVEGNLVRTKRETEKGIITISESRSSNTKQ